MKKFFKDSELRCPCCGNSKMDENFLTKLTTSRALAGIPFILNSAWRCALHNKDVGSSSLNHVTGKAVDIRCQNSHDRFLIAKALLDAGMLGIGISKSFIHCDTNRETPMIWLY